MTESELEKKAKKYAESKNCLLWKFESPSNAGVPDRILIAPNGIVAFIEFKSPKLKNLKARPLQQYRISLLNKRKIRTLLTKSFEEVKEFIDEICT
jgi:hypothetical protein